ncbi:hypothetical protein LCGC14_0388740 [marine sediment metagenome]|uniref:Uncharacterized protein n=1 Tax=marine sediment metagenome TaxID=412755 RepID=A0A0F9TIE7_9ZZZZ
MIYTSNLNSVIDSLNVKLSNIKNTDSLLQDIAVSIASSNVRRIHNESQDVSGAEITYKRSRKTPTKGAYSKSYASRRTNKGRQIQRVDFSFTGKLSKEFQAAPIPGGWGVGFTTPSGSKISAFLEENFGNVWGITQEDNNAINRIVTKEINKKLK